MLEAQRHRGPPVCIDGLWVCARLQQQPDTAGVAACRRPVQRSPVAVGVETVGNLGRQQVGGPQALLELSRVVQCRVDGRLVSMDAIEEPLWVGASWVAGAARAPTVRVTGRAALRPANGEPPCGPSLSLFGL